MLQYFCSVSKVHIGKGTWWLPTKFVRSNDNISDIMTKNQQSSNYHNAQVNLVYTIKEMNDEEHKTGKKRTGKMLERAKDKLCSSLSSKQVANS